MLMEKDTSASSNGRSIIIDRRKSLCDCRKALRNDHHDHHYLDIAGCSGMHLQPTYFGCRISLHRGFNTSWG